MISLTRAADGSFDIEFLDVTSDVQQANAVAAVYMALFTDGAVAGERGWGAESDGMVGSRLWHLRRQALSAEARREVVTEIERCLNSAGGAVFAGVVVSDVTPAGSVSEVAVQITGQHNGRAFNLSLMI